MSMNGIETSTTGHAKRWSTLAWDLGSLDIRSAAEDVHRDAAASGICIQAEQVWYPDAGVVADRENAVARLSHAERRAGAQDELLVVTGAAEDLHLDAAGSGIWLLHAEQVWSAGAGVIADRETEV